MNGRIQELADQCYVYKAETLDIWFNKEKFAELIVKKCVEVMRLVPYDCEGPEFGSEVVYQYAVKKHFGVDE